jgi:ribosomal protein S18 acetylase RimI-like enzyme
MLGERTLSTTALESDSDRIAALRELGYERVERHNVRYRRSLAAKLTPLRLPGALRVEHATEATIAERVDVHRDAWSVWGNSSFSANRYRQLRSTPIYDETLDLAVMNEAGRMLSYCICWFDEPNGIGHFEPVGTRPEAVGRGLGRAVVTEGLRRLKERGAHTALIGTASVNGAALRTYAACGFELVEREHFYSTRLE